MRSFYRKRKIIFILLIVVGIVSLSSITYAIFTVTTSQDGVNNISTMTCLELTFSNQENEINLVNTYPMSDERGAKNTPYTFTLTNNCGTYVEFSIGLRVNSATTLDNSYVKTLFNTRGYEDSPYLLTNRSIFEYEDGTAYLLKTDGLDSNQSENYEFKLWLDEDTPRTAANKMFSGTIILSVSAKTKPSTNDGLKTYLFVDGMPSNTYPTINEYTYDVKCKDYDNNVVIENNFITFANDSFNSNIDHLSNVYKYCNINFYHNQSDFNLNYTKVSFIKSNGGEYIDTGYYPKPITRIYVDAQYDDLSVQSRVFQAAQTFFVDTYINGSGKFAFAYQDDNGNWVNTKLDADYSRHTFDLDGYNKTYKIDNGTLYSKSLSEYTATKISTFPLTYFAQFSQTSGKILKYSHVKLYDAKIYESETLIKNYVPCMRKSDNVVGLYDLINKEFVTTNTGNLYAGVPDEYETVTSIDSNGSEYIDTNYYVSPNTRIFIDAKFNDLTVQSRLYGADALNGSGLVYHFYINSASKWAFAYQDNSGNWISTNILADTNRHIFDFDGYNKTFAIDSGNTYSTSLSSYFPALTSVTTLHLFSNGQNNAKSKITFYGTRLYENNILQREYIPCVRKSDNRVGVYEIVSQTFITSPVGNLTLTS